MVIFNIFNAHFIHRMTVLTHNSPALLLLTWASLYIPNHFNLFFFLWDSAFNCFVIQPVTGVPMCMDSEYSKHKSWIIYNVHFMPKFIMKKMIMNWVLVVVLFLIELRGKHHRYNIFFCVWGHYFTCWQNSLCLCDHMLVTRVAKTMHMGDHFQETQ